MCPPYYSFDLYFRKNPFGGEYTVFAGLDECVKFLANFKLTHQEIDYVRDSLPGSEVSACWFLNLYFLLFFVSDLIEIRKRSVII